MEDPIWGAPELLHRCLVAHPLGQRAGLPVLYLLHGQYDKENDWFSEKGQLAGILAGVRACPMLLVMPFVGTAEQTEPTLDEVRSRIKAARKNVAERFEPDEKRQGMLGISMGAKQALSIVLKDKNRAGFSVLGLLSGKFQGDNLTEVKKYVEEWPQAIGQTLDLYFHYCGAGEDVPRAGDKPLTGDRRFLDNNRLVAKDLAGGELRTRDDGLHNWYFWRPQLAEFFRSLSRLWATSPGAQSSGPSEGHA